MWSYWFPESVILNVYGKDAVRYTHNRLSGDIRALAVGGATIGAALSPQGKVLALFSVFLVAADRLLLVADGGEAEAVRQAFAQYIVADRVRVESCGDDFRWLHIGAASDSEELIAGFMNARARGEIFWGASTRGESGGYDLLVSQASVVEVTELIARLGVAQYSRERYTLERVRSGHPMFPDELNENSLLSEAGRRDAVVFGKGCYVGQEVIEKIDAVGRVPRELRRFVAPGKALDSVGQTVNLEVDSSALGKVITEAYDPEKQETWFFGYVRSGQVAAGSTVRIGEKHAKVL
jgi:tRNA-modifying protein YgfZ